MHRRPPSTLTTSGHVYATDTFGYAESSGYTATESEAVGNTANEWIGDSWLGLRGGHRHTQQVDRPGFGLGRHLWKDQPRGGSRHRRAIGFVRFHPVLPIGGVAP